MHTLTTETYDTALERRQRREADANRYARPVGCLAILLLRAALCVAAVLAVVGATWCAVHLPRLVAGGLFAAGALALLLRWGSRVEQMATEASAARDRACGDDEGGGPCPPPGEAA